MFIYSMGGCFENFVEINLVINFVKNIVFVFISGVKINVYKDIGVLIIFIFV